MAQHGTASTDDWHTYDTPDGTPQLDRAKAWLTDYPDLQGLSLRKAADKAGVSVATMRRAIQARKDAQKPLL